MNLAIMLQEWGLLCPQMKKLEFSVKLEELKMFGNKTSKTDWLDQVEDRWDKLMFQEALNWKTREIPKELKNRLSNKVGD